MAASRLIRLMYCNEQKPQVIAPVVGATKMSHLEEAVGALNVKLTLEEIDYLEKLYEPHREIA